MEESPSELMKQAELELTNQRWTQALDLFSKALVLLNPTDPEIAHAQNGRGVALLEMQRYAEAVKALETAVLVDPQMAGAYFNLGVCWEGLGHAENALHCYNKAIELEPHDAEFYFRRGGVWFGLEQFEKTIEDTSKAINMHDASAALTGPYIARGLALYRLERYEEAIADFTHVLQVDPRGACEGFFYRALVYIDRGEALPARADLQAFLTLTDDLEGILAEQAREIIEELDKLDE